MKLSLQAVVQKSALFFFFFQKKPDFKGREASWMGTQELEQKIKI